MDSAGKPVFAYRRATGTTGVVSIVGDEPINDGDWHLVTVTAESSDAKLSSFVDGRLAKTGSFTAMSSAPGQAAAIGSDPDTKVFFDGHMNGRLDDVRLYDRALNEQEIESLYLTPLNLDFGDAPVSYKTRFANDGASHVATGPRLGSLRDSERDGRATSLADGDSGDDGVTFGSIVAGQTTAGANVTLANAANARVDAWIDFDFDGLFESNEKVLDNIVTTAGLNTLNMVIPATAIPGSTFARVRVSTAGGLLPSGMADDGVVEDYRVTIASPDAIAPTIANIFVANSTWTPLFVDAVDGGGVAAGNGLGYALSSNLTIPNTAGIDRIYIQFSEPVVGFNASTVKLLGVNTADYTSSLTVAYDSGNMRGVIQIGSGIVKDKLRIGVSDAVTDVALNALDGDSNGTAGGISNFRFNVLVGDASNDGSVNGGDLSSFSSSFNKSFGNEAYNPRADWNADGSVNGGDLSLFAGNFNQSLPSSEPGSLNFPPPPPPPEDAEEHVPFVDAFYSQLEEEDEWWLLEQV